ncbi:MBL fold metallo-hydrolase [Pseudoroseicyclus tamaricis]|uniref:MBL fold metallo-hydrolase n=1 Tax=Pseudoroseicyclus tamaricis TaxID=2705421 RepID=A0A6B2JZU0_9RHOB|nr:MBL fold metallo-hydrolase [Pseudoroseicyclus tamaricis]NDV01764.1 MBL fold metallo-hydrolase [Pseudoroseicyclus tamaricis]
MRIVLALAALLLATPLAAQERIPSHCLAFAEGEAQVMPASFREPLGADEVRLTFIDHAMFLIQVPGIDVVTDFTGFVGNVDFTPDVVTMNRAHSSHWTPFPDPAIGHVLRGWSEEGGAAEHYLDLGAMLIRNVPTDIRVGDRFGNVGLLPDGNSIFIFEAGGLCIGHLGHLHHEPTLDDYAQIGRLDVVMVPVDGGLTLPQEVLLRAMARWQARVVIPMHWFGPANMERFVAGMQAQGVAVDRRDGNEAVLSRETLPREPTVMVLQSGFLAE